MIKKLTLLAFLAVLGTSAFAQISYGFYAGAIKPAGDLGQTKTINGADDLANIANWCLIDKEGKYGFAGIGFNVGFDMALQIPNVQGLSAIASFDIMYNNSNSDITTYFEEYPKSNFGPGIISGFSSKSPQWLNFPVLFGVSYKYDLSSAFGVFCEAALGPNFRKINSLEFTEDYYSTVLYQIGTVFVPVNKREVVYDYDLAVTFGFKVGAGILLWNDHISIGFDYYALGSSKIKGKKTVKLDGTDYSVDLGGNIEGDNSISSSELVFRIGYHFQ